MDRKAFNKITNQIFLQYGFFQAKRNTYVLVLEEVDVCVSFVSWRGVKFFDYIYSIRAAWEEGTPLEQRFEGISIKMEHNTELEGYHRHEIIFENWTEEAWRIALLQMLHKYFDPFKENAILHIKNQSLLTARHRKYLNAF